MVTTYITMVIKLYVLIYVFFQVVTSSHSTKNSDNIKISCGYHGNCQDIPAINVILILSIVCSIE